MQCSIFKHRIFYSARNCEFANLGICKIRNAKFDILQEILESHPFLMSRKFELQGC